VSIYSNTETSLAMSTLAIWRRVVQSRDVSPHNFDGRAMSGLAFSVAAVNDVTHKSAATRSHIGWPNKFSCWL